MKVEGPGNTPLSTSMTFVVLYLLGNRHGPRRDSDFDELFIQKLLGKQKSKRIRRYHATNGLRNCQESEVSQALGVEDAGKIAGIFSLFYIGGCDPREKHWE